MITVSVSINGEPIYARSAVRVGNVAATKLKQTYKVDDGSEVKHNYVEGAIVLAKKLLDTIHEVKT